MAKHMSSSSSTSNTRSIGIVPLVRHGPPEHSVVVQRWRRSPVYPLTDACSSWKCLDFDGLVLVVAPIFPRAVVHDAIAKTGNLRRQQPEAGRDTAVAIEDNFGFR